MKLFHAPYLIELQPYMPGVCDGGFLGGWDCTYKVLRVQVWRAKNGMTILVRDLYFWERLWLWLREDLAIEWIVFKSKFKRRLKWRVSLK